MGPHRCALSGLLSRDAHPLDPAVERSARGRHWRAVRSGHPYLASANQDGFTTFGGPHIATLLTEVAARVLKAQWFQKWYVHRNLRPEAYAGRVHNHVRGAAHYPLGPDVLDSPAL